MSIVTVLHVKNGKTIGTAIQVQPHGDLIDRDKLKKKEWSIDWENGQCKYYNADDINNAPSVIPLEEGN